MGNDRELVTLDDDEENGESEGKHENLTQKIQRDIDVIRMRDVIYFVVLLVSVLVFGLGIWLTLGSTQNKVNEISTNQNIDSSPTAAAKCTDDNPTTQGVLVGETGACQQLQLANGATCTSEGSGSCYVGCTIQNGKPSGACGGECPGTFFSIYPVNCVKPIFNSLVQTAINSLSLFYFRDCYLGRCRTFVDYTLGDMIEPIGHSSEQSLFPGGFNRLDYDTEREKQCLNLVSNLDTNKQCYKAVVWWQFSVVTFDSRYVCEFTFDCARLSTLALIGDTPIDTVPFGKKIHKKRFLEQSPPLTPDPSNPISFWFPRKEVITTIMASPNPTTWWAKLPATINSNIHSTASTVQSNVVLPSQEDCVRNIIVDVGINISIVNEAIANATVGGLYNLTDVMGSVSGGLLEDLDWFYAFLYYLRSANYCPTF